MAPQPAQNGHLLASILPHGRAAWFAVAAFWMFLAAGLVAVSSAKVPAHTPASPSITFHLHFEPAQP